jgi:hypothetical protein
MIRQWLADPGRAWASAMSRSALYLMCSSRLMRDWGPVAGMLFLLLCIY